MNLPPVPIADRHIVEVATRCLFALDELETADEFIRVLVMIAAGIIAHRFEPKHRAEFVTALGKDVHATLARYDRLVADPTNLAWLADRAGQQ